MAINVSMDKLLAVAEGCSKDSLRPVLRCLHFKKDVIESTDGFMLLQIKNGESVKKEVLVPVESIKQAKALTTTKLIPVVIDKDTIQSHAGNVSFNVEEMTFPVTEKVIPKIDDKKQANAMLSIKLLEKVIKSAKLMGIERLTMRVDKESHLSPVRFDDEVGQFLAVVMPLNY